MRSENKLYKKYLKEGPDNFRPVQLLELLLCHVHSEDMAREEAKKIMDEFGSITTLLSADSELLMENSKFHPDTVCLLKILSELPDYMKNEEKEGYITTKFSAVKYATELLRGSKTEKFYITVLDSDKKILSTKLIAAGDVNEVLFDIQRMLQFISTEKEVKSILLMHNHPGGSLNPSKDDIYMTEQIEQLVKTVDIELYDHIIITDGYYVSMRESGYIY